MIVTERTKALTILNDLIESGIVDKRMILNMIVNDYMSGDEAYEAMKHVLRELDVDDEHTN